MISLAPKGGRRLGFATPNPYYHLKESTLDGPQPREPGLATLVPEQESGSPRLGRLLAILWVRSGLRGVAQFAVRGADASIGRDGANDLVLDSPAVSAHHARLALAGGVWTLTDLGSVNGSWVDGERLAGTLPLAPGSEVRIADVVLAFAPRDEWSDSPMPAVPARAPQAPVGPLFLPSDDTAGPRRLLQVVIGVVILGLLAYLLLVRR